MDFWGNPGSSSESPFHVNGGILESSNAEFLLQEGIFPNKEGGIMNMNSPHMITTNQMINNSSFAASSNYNIDSPLNLPSYSRFTNPFSVPQQQQVNWQPNQVTVLNPRNRYESTQVQTQQNQVTVQQQICPPKQVPENPPSLSAAGTACSNKMVQYLHHHRNRPKHNNKAFWRKFVNQFFDHNVKKRLCLATYPASEGHAHFAFSRGVNFWNCNICGTIPGKGFEASYEVLPRWLQLNFENGVVDEYQSLDIPLETILPSGHMMLLYRKVVKHTMYKNTRIVREGQLRVTFTADLKIIRWESCARGHEEFVLQRAIAPQMKQLSQVSQRCEENLTRNISEGNLRQSVQASHNRIVKSEEQLAKTLDTQVNDLGLTKSFSRFLQLTEVVSSMRDIMIFSHETQIGPLESFNIVAQSMRSNANQQNAQGFFPTGNPQMPTGAFPYENRTSTKAEAERAWNLLSCYRNVQPAGNSNVQGSSSSGIRSGNFFPQPQAHEDPRMYVMNKSMVNNGGTPQPIRPSQIVLTGSRYGPYGRAVGQRGPRREFRSASQARRSTVNNNNNSNNNDETARLAVYFRGNETIDVDALPDLDAPLMFPGVKIKDKK